MQTFEEYLKDIWKLDPLQFEFRTWVSLIRHVVLMQYADDYAKECIRLDHERIIKGINKKQADNYTELGTNKHDWCYEQCIDVVNTFDDDFKEKMNVRKDERDMADFIWGKPKK